MGFFNQNLVMEYSRERAVADGVNVDGEVYRIRTRITEQGSRVEAGYCVDKRDRQHARSVRWEQLDEDLDYDATQLDRDVVVRDQIRTVIRTFRDRLFTEIFPGRTEVPKTLVFAKDDSHAEDIVRIVREEFGKGNEFCQKITYKVTGDKPEDLIAAFRNSYNPRIAVTVDMISTGTDIKPLEVLLFMRPVQSRVLLRADEGPRHARHQPHRPAGRDARRRAQDPLCHRGRGGRGRASPRSTPRRWSASARSPSTSCWSRWRWACATRTRSPRWPGGWRGWQRKLTPQDEDSDPRRQRRAVAARPGQRACWTPWTPTSTWRWPRPRPGRPTRRRSRSPRPRERAGRRGPRRPSTTPTLRQTLIAIHAARRADHRHGERGPRHRGRVQRRAGAGRRWPSFRQFIEENRDEITALQIIYSQPYAQQRLTYAAGQGAGGRASSCRPTPGPPSRCGGPTPSWSGTRCAAWARSGC